MTGCAFGEPPHDEAVFCANCEDPVCGYHADRSDEDDELLCPPCAEAEAERLRRAFNG